MKIGVVTKYGTGLPLAIRCLLEGNEVLMYYTKKKTHRTGEGMIEDTDSINKLFAFKPDIIVFDGTGYRGLADQLRKSGFAVCGNSELHDKLEFDREDALAVIEHSGISVPPTYTTATFKDAAAFVKKNPKPYVIKLDSEKYAGSSMTFVGSGPEEIQEMLDIYQTKVKGKVTINLQEKVEGVEISTEGFFDGEKFLPTWNHTLERKKIMDGDLGPAIGCSGDVVWWTEENKVISKGLKKMAPILKRLGFYGQIDLNTIVSKEGKVWALELTPRFGYNATLTMMNLLNQPFYRLLADLARRTLTSIKIRSGYGLSVSVSIPPFPSVKSEMVEKDVPILGVKKDDIPILNPFDVYFDGHFKSAGSEGWLFSPVGTGETIDEARRKAYNVCYRLKIPNKQMRTDIGLKAKRDYDMLKSWGMI